MTNTEAKTGRPWVMNVLCVVAILALFLSFLPGAVVRAHFFGWWPEALMGLGVIALSGFILWCFYPRSKTPQRGDIGYRIVLARTRKRFYGRASVVLAIICSPFIVYNMMSSSVAAQKLSDMMASKTPEQKQAIVAQLRTVRSNMPWSLRLRLTLTVAITVMATVCGGFHIYWGEELSRLIAEAEKRGEEYCLGCGYSFACGFPSSGNCPECGESQPGAEIEAKHG